MPSNPADSSDTSLPGPAAIWADLHGRQLELFAHSQRAIMGAAHAALQQHTQFTLDLWQGWSQLACAGLGADTDAAGVEHSAGTAVRGLSACADAAGKAQQQWLGQVQDVLEAQVDQMVQALHDVEDAALMPAQCKGEVGL